MMAGSRSARFGLQLAADLVVLSACRDRPRGRNPVRCSSWRRLGRVDPRVPPRRRPAGCGDPVARRRLGNRGDDGAVLSGHGLRGAPPARALALAQQSMASEQRHGGRVLRAGFVIVSGAEPTTAGDRNERGEQSVRGSHPSQFVLEHQGGTMSRPGCGVLAVVLAGAGCGNGGEVAGPEGQPLLPLSSAHRFRAACPGCRRRRHRVRLRGSGNIPNRPPGHDPNPANGQQEQVTVVNGGWDPVSIAAQVGTPFGSASRPRTARRSNTRTPSRPSTGP